MSENEKKDYCIISKEIVILLEWLISHEDKAVENLIKKIWKKGFGEIYLEQKDQHVPFDEYVAQQTVIDFFSLLDSKLELISKPDIMHKQKEVQKTLEDGFSLFLERNESCDSAVERSISALHINQPVDQDFSEKDKKKSLFFKQFLKNWDAENAVIE